MVRERAFLREIMSEEVKKVTRWLLCKEKNRTVFVDAEKISSVSAEVYPAREGFIGKVIVRTVDGQMVTWWSSQTLKNAGDALTQAEAKAKDVIRFLVGKSLEGGA